MNQQGKVRTRLRYQSIGMVRPKAWYSTWQLRVWSVVLVETLSVALHRNAGDQKVIIGPPNTHQLAPKEGLASRTISAYCLHTPGAQPCEYHTHRQMRICLKTMWALK